MKAELMDPSIYQDYLLNDKMVSPSSAHSYMIMVSAFLARNPDIDNINDYNEYLIEVAFKKRSLIAYYALKWFIEYKFKGEVKKELIEGLRKPPANLNLKRERRTLSDEKIMEVISKLSHPCHQTIALIQKLTGLRAGDVIRIKAGNIVAEKYETHDILKIVAEGKRKKRHIVEIFDKTGQDLILNYISNLPKDTVEDYYFLRYTHKNKKYTPGNTFLLEKANYSRYWADMKIAMNACGILREEYATHDYRRNFAKNVWMKYKDLYLLQRVLGHTKIETTIRYLHGSGLDLIDCHKAMQLGDNK